MKFWFNIVGYQLVWFSAVIGAGQGLAWPGVTAAAVFAVSQLWISGQRVVELKLVAAALLIGLLVDGGLGGSGLARYAASWGQPFIAPAWILALWVSFALTLSCSLSFLQQRPWWALALGAVGGPLAYLGAGRGWGAMVFAAPEWRGLLYLAVCWGLAMPVLAHLAGRWNREPVPRTTPLTTGGLR